MLPLGALLICCAKLQCKKCDMNQNDDILIKLSKSSYRFSYIW